MLVKIGQGGAEREMKQLEIKNGTIFLDGEKVPCVKSFNVKNSEKDKGIAELTVCMDVTIAHHEELIESE